MPWVPIGERCRSQHLPHGAITEPTVTGRAKCQRTGENVIDRGPRLIEEAGSDQLVLDRRRGQEKLSLLANAGQGGGEQRVVRRAG